WARIVAPDLRLLAAYGFDDVVAADAGRLAVARRRTAGRRRGSRGRGGTDGAGKRRNRFLARAAQDERGLGPRDTPRRRRLLGEANPPQEPDGLLVHAFLHRLEQLEAFFLVFDERIALPVAAQADAFFQVIEAVEMVLPLRVDDLEHDVALDAMQHLAADLGFLFLVRRLRHVPDRVADLVGRLVAEVERREVRGKHLAGLAFQRVDVPVLVVALSRRVLLDLRVEHVFAERHQVFVGVDDLFFAFFVFELDRALENLPAQRVDV